MDIVDRMRSKFIGPQDCEDAAVEIERLRADKQALRMALRAMVDTADRVDLDRPTFGECKAMRMARAALVAVDG